MSRLAIRWLINTVSLLIVTRLVPGFNVSGLAAALLAAIVIGFVNSTLGLLLKIITFPLTILTLGLFWFVINALMLEVASWLVPGFFIRSFGSAFIGALALSLVNLVLKALILD